MKKILILFAHPALQRSRINKHLISGIDQIAGVTLHDLYQAYPEFDIDVNREQALIQEHEVIVFHHPFFWYSTPAILKEWQDLVLEHGWAYGKNGDALKNKWFFNVVSTGGGETAYAEGGHNNFAIRQLLSPIEQTANLCKLIFLPPFVVHGSHSILREELDMHRQNYHKLLYLINEGEFQIEKAKNLKYLNHYIEEERN